MEDERIAKKVYISDCAASHSVDRLWKKGIEASKVNSA